MAEGRELNDIKTDSKGDNLLDVKFDPLDCDKRGEFYLQVWSFSWASFWTSQLSIMWSQKS